MPDKKQAITCRTREDCARAAIAVAQMPIDDPMLVTWEPLKPTRTEKQNRYLWGWLYWNIAKQLGEAGIVIPSDDGREFPYTKNLLHDIFKEQFLCYAEITRGQKTRKLCYSTSELVRKTEKEEDEQRCFSTYVENIKEFCFQVWRIHVPPTSNEELIEFEKSGL